MRAILCNQSSMALRLLQVEEHRNVCSKNPCILSRKNKVGIQCRYGLSIYLLVAARTVVAVVVSRSSFQPAKSHTVCTLSSQSPCRKRSRFGVRRPMPPTGSKLNKTRGQLGATHDGIPATGMTSRLVPKINSKSQPSMSLSMSSMKRDGISSPKNTMSGLTSDPHSWHTGALPLSTIAFRQFSMGIWRFLQLPLTHEADRKCPWHSTSLSVEIPASASRPSIFCV